MNFWCFLFLAFGSVEFHFYKIKLSSNDHLKSSNGYICVQIIRVVLGFSLNDFVLADEQSQPFLFRYGCHCSRAIFWLGKWLHCWSMIWCVLEPKFGFASTVGDALRPGTSVVMFPPTYHFKTTQLVQFQYNVNKYNLSKIVE